MSSRTSQRAVFLDASAIIAYHVETQVRREVLLKWWPTEALKYTSPFCLFETLNYYKSMWKGDRKPALSHEQYRTLVFNTHAWYRAAKRYVNEVSLDDPNTFQETYLLAMKHELDMSDAFQLTCLKTGYFSCLVNESSTLLVTGDTALAKAASAEGLVVWNFRAHDEPP